MSLPRLITTAKYILYISAFLYSAFTLIRILLTFHLFDYHIHYQAVQDLLVHKNLYLNLTTDNNYPPTAFLFSFLPSLLPEYLAEKVWTILSLSAFLISIYFLFKSITKKFSWMDFILIYLLAMLSFPIKFTFGLGQINFLILLFLVLVFYFFQNKRYLWSGGCIALAGAIKLTPIFLILYFLKKRAYKTVISSMLAFILINILAVILFGLDLIKYYYLQVLPTIPPVGNAAYYNQALTGFLARLEIPFLIAFVVNYSFFGLLTLLSLIFTQKSNLNKLASLTEYGLFITSWLIGAGLSWQHHLVWLLIPFAAIFLYLKNNKNKPIFYLTIISYLLISYNIKQSSLYQGFYTLWLSHELFGMLILFGVLLYIKKLSFKTP